MKIAVVTPYFTESSAILKRCHESVMSQSYKNVVHIMIADGHPNLSIADMPNVEHIILSDCHEDAGATPRAIGAISAFSRNFDAVAFLDADNTFTVSHLETMVNAAGDNDVVTATRNICDTNGVVMYTDTIESTGSEFCDTNCLFIKNTILHLLTHWIATADRRLLSDRQFWNVIANSTANRVHITVPTVNYYSKWSWHYEQAGMVPPADSVRFGYLNDGTLIQHKYKDTLN